MSDIYKDKDYSYYSHNRPELLPFIPGQPKRVLDVGCGSGGFGSALKQIYNCEVWGIEPNEKAVKEAETRIDKSICNIFTDNVPELAGQQFDIIFFNDVLEHLSDPTEALITCKSYLSEGGHIVASMPNMRWYPVMLNLIRNKDFKYELQGVMDKTHLKFFTYKSMRRMFEEAGYRVDKLEGINKDEFKAFNFINLLLFNSQWDMKFKQFVTVASLA